MRQCFEKIYFPHRKDRKVYYLTTITKEQTDFMEELIKWDDETKVAFMFAKRIFEKKDE